MPFRACYSECDACGTLYQTPMPALDALADFYVLLDISRCVVGWMGATETALAATLSQR